MSDASPVSRTLLVLCVNQGISASFSLSLSYRWLCTTRFWSIKGPQQVRVCEMLWFCSFLWQAGWAPSQLWEEKSVCVQSLFCVIYVCMRAYTQPWFIQLKQTNTHGDFPAGPVGKTPYSQCRGPGLIPGQGTRPHMPQLWPGAAQNKTEHHQVLSLINYLRTSSSVLDYVGSFMEGW